MTKIINNQTGIEFTIEIMSIDEAKLPEGKAPGTFHYKVEDCVDILNEIIPKNKVCSPKQIIADINFTYDDRLTSYDFSDRNAPNVTKVKINAFLEYCEEQMRMFCIEEEYAELIRKTFDELAQEISEKLEKDE